MMTLTIPGHHAASPLPSLLRAAGTRLSGRGQRRDLVWFGRELHLKDRSRLAPATRAVFTTAASLRSLVGETHWDLTPWFTMVRSDPTRWPSKPTAQGG